jgi:hypothetical protein
MCVNTIDGKFDMFHFTAICHWCQFHDSMERNIEIWQFIWKNQWINISPLKQIWQDWYHKYEGSFSLLYQTQFIPLKTPYTFFASYREIVSMKIFLPWYFNKEVCFRNWKWPLECHLCVCVCVHACVCVCNPLQPESWIHALFCWMKIIF